MQIWSVLFGFFLISYKTFIVLVTKDIEKEWREEIIH